jgi:hypothetical protein
MTKPNKEGPMKVGVQLRVSLREPQADQLRRRLDMLPFKVSYREEQHGPQLLGVISCTPAQEKTLREILMDLGTTTIDLQD